MTRLSAILAALVGAAGLVAVSPVPAQAATCAGAGGVSVVVDFGSLGGVQSSCVTDGGGRSAASLFTSAGFALRYVQGQADFVCTVKSLPADANCSRTPPASAYWSLWWSDGKSGKWGYSSRGVSSLDIPAGGYVGFSWDDQDGQAVPGVTPAPHPAATPTVQPSAKPSAQPSAKPTRKPKPSAKPGAALGAKPGASGAKPGAPAAPGSTPTAAATPSVAPTESPTAVESAGESASASPSPGASEPAPPDGAVPVDPLTSSPPSEQAAADAASDDTVEPAAAEQADGALPTWVVLGVLLLVLSAIGGVVVARRRGGSQA